MDFSEISDEALEMAVQLAEKNASLLNLIYVLPRPNFYDWTLTGMSNVVLDDYFVQTKKEIEAKMKGLVQLLQKSHPFLEVKYIISDKMDAATAIVDIAKEIKSDLIILGSHGRRGMNRVLMGSVAESVMRHAGCAVMIYKSKAMAKKK